MVDQKDSPTRAMLDTGKLYGSMPLTRIKGLALYSYYIDHLQIKRSRFIALQKTFLGVIRNLPVPILNTIMCIDVETSPGIVNLHTNW